MTPRRAVLAATAVLVAIAVPAAVLNGFAAHAVLVVIVALPLAFLVVVLRRRLAVASVGRVVHALEQVSAGTVEQALAEALRDPGLRVAFRVPGGLLDVTGEPFREPAGPPRRHSPLGDAVVVHDPALPGHLLDAAAGTARLALDNARLHADLRAQVSEVRASQRRIAVAADAECRRLELDLRDGAEQRLLEIGRVLAGLGAGLSLPPDRDRVTELRAEIREAVGELRRLTHGARPAVLTDRGLAPALDVITSRAPAGARLDVRVRDRLDPMIEDAAYYVVSEALQNVAKHARESGVRVSAVQRDTTLVVTVADDGPGGACPDRGSGLRGLADRVGTVGGRLAIHSPPGAGTTVRAELPVRPASGPDTSCFSLMDIAPPKAPA